MMFNIYIYIYIVSVSVCFSFLLVALNGQFSGNLKKGLSNKVLSENNAYFSASSSQLLNY